MSIAAIVLAAGSGSRFAGGATHKLLAPFRGRPLVAWAIDAAASAGLDELIVVSGAVELAALLPAAATLVVNEHWSQGQAGSLRAGLAACRSAGHEAAVVGLGDQPLVPASAWVAVATAPAARIAAASYAGARRNPVRLHHSVWQLVPATGDEGARAVMRRHPELVVEVPCEGDPADVDTIEDLRSIR